ncbi:ecotin family protein [Thaumasiovibrio subtropicus]|uniref:ecotin family protein n=1 Tax=Thaumasiovibrio subtropicus TaxID=1891207 RepID=UPI00131A8ABB|nr:ecotin family protein [Thaumasiovibrio subtropicus]
MKKLTMAAGLMMIAMSTSAKEVSVHMFSTDMYPELTMHSFILDARAEEQNALLQLVASKTMEVDCNVRHLNVNVERKSLEGWGYPYFVITEAPTMGTTLLPCDKEMRELESARGELHRYNSKVPLVIYAPEDLDIDYRVWSVEE